MSKERKRPVLEAIQRARPQMKLRKTGFNKHLGYKYPTLDDYYDAVLEPLERVGCTLSHARFPEDGRLLVRTIVLHHETGDLIEDIAFIESEKAGNQGQGSALTYMIKDAIRCLLALPSEDDDAQSEQIDIKKQNEEPASAYNVGELSKLITQSPNPVKMLRDILGYNKVSTLEELGEQQCSRAAYRVREIIKSP